MRFVWLLSMFALSFNLAAASVFAESWEGPAATFLVHDYAGVPADQMARAQETVTRWYQRAGIAVDWTCERRLPYDGDTTAADNERKLSASALTVIVLDGKMAEQHGSHEDIVGSAPSTPGARIAYVFHHRLQEIAQATSRDPADLLALVVAHEIGHLLLPPGAHTSGGVMRPRWHLKELRSVNIRGLRFTDDQARQMLLSVEALATKPPVSRIARHTM